MRQPLHQTPAQKEAEKEFANLIERRFNCESHWLPVGMAFDYVLSRHGRFVCLAELKIRTIPSDKYDTAFINRHKLTRGLEISKHLAHWDTKDPIPLMLFIRYTDGDFFLKLEPRHLEKQEFVKLTNHDNDFQYICHLPIADFQKF